MKIVIDAMGGDNAPQETVKGAVEAVKQFNVDIVLTGDIEEIAKELEKHSYPKEKIEIVNCSEVIKTDEKPVVAIRRKKDSSLVVAINMVKDGKADAIISAGNTGAILAGGLFILGRMKGINRPALAPVYPTAKGVSILIDGGSNPDCKPKNLLEFGVMGSLYANKLLNVDKPSVCLVNIGIEEGKGNELVKEAYEIFKKAPFNFQGNVEARDVSAGYADVIVCDGFTGNIILKLTEGVAGTIFKMLKKELMKSPIRKLGALLIKSGLKSFKKSFDYSEYGGAPFLGVKGVVIKAHGSSNAKAIKNAVRQAKILIETNIVEDIEKEIVYSA
ncbi:MAG: phosphate acyltransferase PlsX, partial [Clostridiales bacterium]|nr:phosphate acyltransferase PlsX [Clostridiales bacterium]